MSDDLLSTVRAMPIAQVLAMMGWTVDTRGKMRGWPCPACGCAKRANGTGILPKDPRAWSCFACGAGGTAIDLWLYHRQIYAKRLDRQHFDALRDLLGLEAPEIRQFDRVERPSMSPAQVAGYWRTYARCHDSRVARWLSEARGLDIGQEWGSVPQGAAHTQAFREAARENGVCAWALRSTHPERLGQVRNIALRRMEAGAKPITMVSGEGACSDDGYPLCYGDPTEIEREHVVLVEGACDWMAARAWAPPDWGVVGARCAGDIASKWGKVLAGRPYVVVVPHIDKLDARGRRAGPDACKALQQQIGCRLFRWRQFWAAVGAEPRDLADTTRRDVGFHTPFETARQAFCACI